MTHDADLDDTARGAPLLRLMTLVVGSVEVILFVLLAHLVLQSTDPLGEMPGERHPLLVAAPLLLLTLPGLVLAWLDRAPRTALTLVLLAIPAATAIWL
jgi:hypothetical protein